MQNIPLFGASASLISPPGGTVTSGYFPLQYLPAENINYYLNAETQAIQELITVINFAGLTPSSSTNQLLAAISGLMNSAFQLGTYVNKVAITQPATLATLTLIAGKTFTVNNTLTLSGTDGKTLSIGRNITLQGANDVVADIGPAFVGSDYNGLGLAFVSTTSFSVATGSIGDSTYVNTLTLLASTTKTTSAWAVGSAAGGLDTGAIAASTWYAVYLIKRTDTNVVDVIFSTSGTSPTLPANYTLYRRIGWVRTNGSSQFISFQQVGRQFYWSAKVAELSAATPGSTNRILTTVTCPINVEGIFVVNLRSIATGIPNFDMGWTALTDSAASSTNNVLQENAGATWQGIGAGMFRVRVDASNQIYYRVDSTTLATVTLLTLGWIDNLI